MIRTFSRHDEVGSDDLFDTFVHRESEDSFFVGGWALDMAQWTERLSHRAAYDLWFKLTRVLYPERAKQVLSQVSTLEALPRVVLDDDRCCRIDVALDEEDGSVYISKSVVQPGWCVRLSAAEVYRFWAALDRALFPTGW